MSKYFVLLMTIGAVAAIQKVPVGIYYEPLCPDSQAFFTKQFTPTWRDLQDYIDLKLVPFGKANATSFANPNLRLADVMSAQAAQGLSWTCSHGPNECDGDKYQGCVIASDSHISTNDQVIFIDCLMTHGKKEDNYQNTVTMCTDKFARINKASLIQCATGEQGKTHIWENGKATLALTSQLDVVPTIVFKSKYNKEESEMARKSFRAALCKHIDENPKPKMCDGNGGVRTTTTGLMTLISAALVFRML